MLIGKSRGFTPKYLAPIGNVRRTVKTLQTEPSNFNLKVSFMKRRPTELGQDERGEEAALSKLSQDIRDRLKH